MGGKGLKRNRSKTPVHSYKNKRSKAEYEIESQPTEPEPETETLVENGVDLEQTNPSDAGNGAVSADVEEDGAVISGSKEKKLIIVLEEACLETVKSKSGKFELLNCDDHLSLHAKLNRDPKHSRPDILHQCLLTLLDSPLNKAGLLTVLVKSAAGVLIEVSPQVRIPRTFKRFAGLMVQLLHDMRIRAAQGSKTLLKVIKNPVTIHVPANARKFGTSHEGSLVDVYEFVNHLPDDPVVFVFGAMAQGKLNPDYVESFLSFSKYPLSGSYALGRLLGAFEKKWAVL